jgi:RHS repeat-associated protein
LSTLVKRTEGNGVTLDHTRPLPYSQTATATTSTSSGSGADASWSNPSNAQASDNAYATASLSSLVADSQYLTETGFGFTVPSTATVTGLQVQVERNGQASSGSQVNDQTVQLVSAGSAVGTNKADTGTNWPASDTTASYGGAADTWSATLTPSVANASGFGVEVRVQSSGSAGTRAANVDGLQATVNYTMEGGDAGDQYTGLDRFGRVVDQAWVDGSGKALDRRQYGYDRDSNRLYTDNLVSSSNSELYTDDGLNQLTTFDRGTLNSGKTAISGSSSRSQSWDYDTLGNMDSQTTDGTAQTPAANKQNEITSISSATTPTYDSDGNMTGDETGRTFKYDAWNRLAEVKNSGGTTLVTYQYDGDDHRVREIRSGTTTQLFYSDQWQVLEEDMSGLAVDSYVWSPVYVDAMIARDRDTNADGTLDERIFALQDTNFNTVALTDTTGAVVERDSYDPYGTFTVLAPSWTPLTTSNYAWAYLFQGLRYDLDAAINWSEERAYNAHLSRWLNNDPESFAAGDVNLYRFVDNKPLRLTDPTGLDMNLSPSSPNRRLPPWEPTYPAADHAHNGSAPVHNGTLEWNLFESGEAGPVVGMEIKYVPAKGNKCTTITFINVVRQTTIGNIVHMGDEEETVFRKQSNVDPKLGDFLDVLPGETDPYYGAMWNGKKWVPDSEDARIGGNAQTAVFQDGPTAAGARKGFGDAIKRFETAVFAIDTQEVLGVITWGFRIEDKKNSGVELLNGTKADVTLAPSEAFKKVVEKANTMAALKHAQLDGSAKITKPTAQATGGTSALP